MRIVSEQSEADIRRKRATDGLVRPLRELAGNLLRVIRGAGKPVELFRQMEACSAAIREYAEAHGHLPPSEVFNQLLDCDAAWHAYRPWIEENRKQFTDRLGDDAEWDSDVAMRRIRNGALQAAASMLLNQIPQHSMGESEIDDGMRWLREAREKESKRYKNVTVEETLEVLDRLRGLRKRAKRTTATKPPDQAAPDLSGQEIRDGTQRALEEGKRGRGRGDRGIYTPDIERRIQEGIRERARRAEAERNKERD